LRTGSADREKTLLISQLTESAAGVAGHSSLAWFSACPLADGAILLSWYLDFSLNAKDRVFEAYPEVISKVRTTLRLVGAAASGTSKNISKAEKVTENIAEIRKDVRVKPSETTGTDVHSSVPKTVVLCPFVRVAEYTVSFGRLLELLLGILVTRVLVRMILQSKSSIGAFYCGLAWRSTPKTS